MLTTKCTILVLIIRFTLIILATCTNETTSTIQTVPPSTRTSPKAYGLQTSPLLWLLCVSSSELTKHSNLLSYIDDTDNIQHDESNS